MRKPIDALRVRRSRFFTVSLAIFAVVSLAGMAAITGCSGDGGPPTDNGTSKPNGVTPLPDDEKNGEVAVADPAVASPQNGDPEPDTGENGDDPNGDPVTPEPTNDTHEEPVEPPPENGDDGGVGPVLQPPEPEVGPFVPDIKSVSPKVVLSSGHQQTCVVNVGDKMPDLTLTDVEGNEKSLAGLYGKKLTAVLFWTADHPYAKEQFERIEREIVEPYGKYGVAVVTINEGNTAEAINALAGQPNVEFPMLLDTEGAALAAVATEKLPRTYLLDASGEVVWLDIEYSEGTRRDLKNAIVWHLTR
jgi:peroxiredoxin